MDIESLIDQAIDEIDHIRPFREKDLLVIGCSTSELRGEKIGTDSSLEIGEEIFKACQKKAEEKGIYLACQCCEHLNRALVVERKYAQDRGLEIVSAVPYPKAGGSFATAAYRSMKDPVLVEHVRAQAGLDIGDTLIGMHLMDVAVPLRFSFDKIGSAHLTGAYTRPKLIGGKRARYE